MTTIPQNYKTLSIVPVNDILYSVRQNDIEIGKIIVHAQDKDAPNILGIFEGRKDRHFHHGITMNILHNLLECFL